MPDNKFSELRAYLEDLRITNLAAIGSYAIADPNGLTKDHLYKERVIKHEILIDIWEKTEEIENPIG